jgi:predicted ATPase/DNA-binding XRE family transcriptional regulator
MQEQHSFGYWLRIKRKALDLTREALADRVGCSISTIRKLEEEERRPSTQIAELLAEIFKVPTMERTAFIQFARGDWKSAPSLVDEEAPWHVSTPALPQLPLTNLPATFTSLIGRDRDIAAVRDLLTKADIRLVTLIGAPGIGKTRLSIAAASNSLDKFSDGVFLIALALLDHPSLIPSTIAQALGHIIRSDLPAEKSLKEGIGNRQMLLVLDNCEHLIDDVTSLASSLLSTCPRLKILTTSREALRIPGEWLYSVPALETPKKASMVDIETISEFPALVLFADRARAFRSDFALNAENIQVVAFICSQLDGLPLAIELAVAHVKTLSLEQIAAQLDDRLALLTSGSRLASSRQQTLRATLDWSYDLLTETERGLFRQLSVFVGGFTLDALESVAQLESEQSVLPVLSGLVDKSLVRVEGRESVRYQLLETICQYAGEKLHESGNARWIHDRHLAYFLRYAEKAEPHLFGAEQVIWAKRLEMEHDNLRAALNWSLESGQSNAGLQMAGALAWFWHNNGHLREGSRWLEMMLTFDSSARGTEQAKALRASSFIARDMGDTLRAKTMADSSIQIYREIGDDQGVGLALIDLGAVLHHEGRREEAITLFQESLHLLQSTGERWGIAYARVFLGDAWFRLGDIERAAIEWEASLKLTRALGDNSLTAWSLGGLADAARLRHEYDRAIGMLKESLKLYRDLGNKLEPPFTLEALGLAAAALGKSQHAARLWGAAASWREAINEQLPVTFQQDYAALMTQARTQLGEEVFALAWSEGQAMSPEQVFDLALME